MFLLLEVQITIIQKETDERSLLIIAIIKRVTKLCVTMGFY